MIHTRTRENEQEGGGRLLNTGHNIKQIVSVERSNGLDIQ